MSQKKNNIRILDCTLRDGGLLNSFHFEEDYIRAHIEVQRIVKMYKKILVSNTLGIHAHNNMQLAFANTISAMQQGVCFVDASVNGMGRGAGNCPIELLMPQVDRDKYRIKPVLKLSDKYYSSFKNNLTWGFSNQQMLTGLFNVHPVESPRNRGADSCLIFNQLDKEKN